MYRPSTTRQCMQTEEGMKVELRYDSRFGKKNTPGANPDPPTTRRHRLDRLQIGEDRLKAHETTMKLEREEREAEKAAATLAKETLAKVTANDPAEEEEEEFVWPALGTSVPTHLRKDLGKTSKHQPLKYAEGL